MTKELPKITITEKPNKEFDEDILRSIMICKNMNIVPVSSYERNIKIDPDFGQKWNYGNLRNENDLWFFAEKNRGENLINKFYNTLTELNPKLKNIKARTIDDKFAVIRGVGTGLHCNDIKYFVEEMNLDAKNESPENAQLWEKAFEKYMGRNGGDTELIQLKTDEKIGYVLSPETCKRVIENKPYQNTLNYKIK